MVCLFKNTNLQNLAMSFLASSNLVYWLVSPARFSRLILEPTLGFLKYHFLIFILFLDIIGVVDEIVFCHVSPKSRRVVFKLSDLRWMSNLFYTLFMFVPVLFACFVKLCAWLYYVETIICFQQWPIFVLHYMGRLLPSILGILRWAWEWKPHYCVVNQCEN